MDRTTLKQWFSKGKKPLASHFAAWIDSFWHKDDLIPINSVENLSRELLSKISESDVRESLDQKANKKHVHIKEDISDFAHTHPLEEINDINTVTARAYTLDFGTTLELIQDVNTIGSITINRVISRNVTALYVTYGDVARQQVNPNGEVSIEIPDGAILNWEIVRGADDALACVGVRYNIKVKED